MSALNVIVLVVLGAASLIASQISYVSSNNDDQRTAQQAERRKETIAQQDRYLVKLREDVHRGRHKEVQLRLDNIGTSLRIINDKLPDGHESAWQPGCKQEDEQEDEISEI